MKKSNYCSCLLIGALGFLVFSSETVATSASSSISLASTVASADSGHLVIRRAANLGSGLFLNVSVDGKKVAALGKGHTYNGSLSAGPHVVSVIVIPNKMSLTPTLKNITVEKGQTYTFTAMWHGNRLDLK
jgi:hypothetical protein